MGKRTRQKTARHREQSEAISQNNRQITSVAPQLRNDGCKCNDVIITTIS